MQRRAAITEGTFDYVIVGAGTAGCVLANRLSEGGAEVLLIEAGPPDSSWILSMPAGLRSAFKPSSRFNWWYSTVEQRHLAQRRVAQPRGKTLGGSSSINGMTWLRGHPADYDAWAVAGIEGWSFRDCLPAFKASERAPHGDPAWRGHNGPVGVQRQERLSVLNQAFLAAGAEAGFPHTDDPNGAEPEGFCRFDMSVWRGRRTSTARAYLHPVADRPNLSVVTGALAERILLHGTRARGVRVRLGRELCTFTASREVIMCAGAFGTPQLLMLSGLGPAAQLGTAGINTILDLPAVGAGLVDHLEVHVQVETRREVSLNRELLPHRMALAGASWFLAKRGIAAVNQCHVGAFLRTPGAERADVQFHFFPAFFGDDWILRADIGGYRIGVGPMRPTSRGTVRLASADPASPPLIDPNYLATDHDVRLMREGLELALATASQPALAAFAKREDAPGRHRRGGEALDAFIRSHAASAYHPCGTARMGHDRDDAAVCDGDLRVRGIEGLRAADASVIPSIPSANINAAVCMIAERAATIIGTGRPASAHLGYLT